MKLFSAPQSVLHLVHHPALLDPLMLLQPPFMLSHISSVLYNHFVLYFWLISGREKRVASCGTWFNLRSPWSKKYLWLWESKGSLSSFYMTLHMAERWDLGISLAHLKSVCLGFGSEWTLPYLTFEILSDLFNISPPPCPHLEYADKMQQWLVSVG